MSDDLGTLKPGDEVARYYQGTYGGDTQHEFHRVARVMPSGRIVLENGERYKLDGKQVGRNGYRIKVATDELREEIRRKDLFYRLRPTLDVWIRLPTATLERIVAALEKEGGRP
jgi:hypothetical protein